MDQSILKSTKKVLQIGPNDASFDLDIITHINSAFSTLTDVGVGPEIGFSIEDSLAQWTDFLPLAEDLPKLSQVKTYLFLHTRLLFDPPTTSFLLDAINKQIEQCLWRISVQREESAWSDPDPSDFLVVDGGDPSGEA